MALDRKAYYIYIKKTAKLEDSPFLVGNFAGLVRKTG